MKNSGEVKLWSTTTENEDRYFVILNQEKREIQLGWSSSGFRKVAEWVPSLTFNPKLDRPHAIDGDKTKSYKKAINETMKEQQYSTWFQFIKSELLKYLPDSEVPAIDEKLRESMKPVVQSDVELTKFKSSFRIENQWIDTDGRLILLASVVANKFSN